MFPRLGLTKANESAGMADLVVYLVSHAVIHLQDVFQSITLVHLLNVSGVNSVFKTVKLLLY